MRVRERREARVRERRVVREREVMGERVMARRPARGPEMISTGVPTGRGEVERTVGSRGESEALRVSRAAQIEMNAAIWVSGTVRKSLPDCDGEDVGPEGEDGREGRDGREEVDAEREVIGVMRNFRRSST